MGLMGIQAYGHVGHATGNLFPVHLGGKRRFKVPKTNMFVKLLRFCKLWPSLICGLLSVKYGRDEISIGVQGMPGKLIFS